MTKITRLGGPIAFPSRASSPTAASTAAAPVVEGTHEYVPPVTRPNIVRGEIPQDKSAEARVLSTSMNTNPTIEARVAQALLSSGMKVVPGKG